MNAGDPSVPDLPPIERLDETDVQAIHRASMHVLENVGVQLNHERAREVVASSGGTVHDDNVVTVPRDVVEDAIAAAPASFTLHARNPDNDVTVGGDGPPVRAPGYGPSNVRTFGGGRRRSRLSDYEELVKLAQVEDVITCTGFNVCEPNDVDRSLKHYDMLERSLTLTDKPVMGSAYGAERARACLEMVAIAVEDPDLRQPYVAGLVNTVPPRRIDAEMLGGLLTYAEHGQPLVISSFTMAGASGPPTLAASMAQTNAENLMGITLAQLVNPGTPVVYGVPTANVDGRYGSLSIGSPESALFVSFAGRMGRYYDVPSRGGGALSDAKMVDYQSGFESALLQAVTSFSGIDFVLNSVGVLESYSTISPEKFVLDCESVRYLDRYLAGVPTDERQFRLDDLSDVEPGGHFLGESDAADPAGQGFHESSVVDKRSYDAWAGDGRKSAFEMGRDAVQRALAAYERPPMDESVERELSAYVETNGTRPN